MSENSIKKNTGANTYRPISLQNIHVTDPFWSNEMELVRAEVLPYQWEILNDRVKNAAPSFCMRNYRIAGKITKAKSELGSAFEAPKYTFRGFETLPEDMEHLKDEFYGFVFQDSDFSKWVEAAAYSLMNHPDSQLEATADEAIDIVCAAQQENGYLDTYYIINGMDKIFTNLKDHHELYCFGHLTEGAIAYYQATGKRKLLDAAIRYADFIDSYFGPEDGKCKGYPGHEIAEMALVRLYEVTGEKRYLNLSRYFIDERGTKPYYWDCEQEKPTPDGEENYSYYQANRPVREQEEAEGHAVRAMYLYSGMTDLARLTNDEALWNACKKLWKNTTEKKMYITGGVGSTRVGEAFTYPYDLPNDLAYAETCASIGLIFWAKRMLEMEQNSEYADVMELALYNTVLSGMALDGKSFFYVNPLEVFPEACAKDERKSHVKPVRQKWFGCACCPPNLARLISSIPEYAYAETDDTLFFHLYMGGTLTKLINGQMVTLEITSAFPWNGKASVTVHTPEGVDSISMKLAFRIPGWAKTWTIHSPELQTNERLAKTENAIENGYFILDGSFQDGDVVTLDFLMRVRLMQANTNVREDIGKVAVMRGPIVYCAEEADNGKDLHLTHLALPSKCQKSSVEIAGQRFPALQFEAVRQAASSADAALYQEYNTAEWSAVTLTLIPYYAWANRGENEMMVWLSV